MSKYSLLIDGELVPGDQIMPVLNPGTEEVLVQCPRASKNQLDAAVAATKPIRPGRPPRSRCPKLLVKMADVIEANSGDLRQRPRGGPLSSKD